MKRLILFLIILLSLINLKAQEKVYLADIDGEIDLGMAPFVRRVVDEAENNGAKAILFRINTFGGRVDAATQIKDAILNSKVRTIAFIDKRAISAGSLIALSCEKIVMVPGASMGATTVVDQAGQKQSEKYQSYMRSEMRATAEKNGRRTDIAEAMVDERVVVPGLVDSTRLVTLTAEEAVKYGMADTVISNLDDVLKLYGFQNDEIVNVSSNWAEEFVKFVNNPIISSLLIMIGLVGLFTEIKTPGWGLPGTAGVIALAIFFGANYILELASVLEISLFVIGFILLLVEIFFIPGFGVTGLLGITMMIAGLFLGLISDFDTIDSSIISGAIIQLAATFVTTGILIFILSKFLPKTSVFSRLILQDNISAKSGYTSKPDLHELIGLTGTAMTDLRPSGTAIINGKRVDVVTEGEYINHNSGIKVTAVQGSKVVVEESKS